MDFPIILVISIDTAHTSKHSRSFARSTRSTHSWYVRVYGMGEFVDNSQHYEHALDYNAPLCFVLAYFAEE